MTKPDFSKTTRKELTKYILSHPTDDEAIRELFINRRNSNFQVFSYAQNIPDKEVEAMFKSKFNLDP
ncbi:DUF6887 family protein [Okeania sp. SIO1I7]|uniref:DUF6887 family protein n=1 Tax=Okeania sp. SIO1I7 TaxID=2607772 RepID=UPI0013FC9AF3|nr:hypothetical protein [Okeania sp. SIO1I7]NET29080.1 hypothetical protein [Okeania sp. SIO1I7]